MKTHRNRGFTLVELMVATGVLVVVVTAVLQSFVVQHQTYQVIEQTVEAQQTGRAVADLLEREIRMTGFMVPEVASACGIDRTAAADTLYVTDSDAIDPTGHLDADLGARVLGGYNGTVSTLMLTVDDVVIDGAPFYDTNGDGAPDSDFRDDAGVILANVDVPGLGTACGRVVDVDLAGNRVRVDFETAIGPVPLGTELVLVPAHVYEVDAQLQLLRDGVTFAPDVEDFQVAYFFDVDGDGQVGVPANENPGAAGTNYVAKNRDHRPLREIRVNIVTRTREANQDNPTSTPIFQATENRAPVAGADGFRRRVQQVAARPRNVGSRGS